MDLTRQEQNKIVLNEARELSRQKGVDVSYENMEEVLHTLMEVPRLSMLVAGEFVGIPALGKLTLKTADLEFNANREINDKLIDELLIVDLKHLSLLKVLNLPDHVKLDRVHSRERILLRRSQIAE